MHTLTPIISCKRFLGLDPVKILGDCPSVGEAKDLHCLRGWHKVKIEGMMIAADQNLKRLIKDCLKKLCSLAQYLFSQLFPARAGPPRFFLGSRQDSCKY